MNFDRTDNLDGRIVALTGAFNFRDIGGYETVEGQVVASRKIYRSGSLARLTPEDQEEIRRLGIRTVCDLRTTSERQRKPSLLPADTGIELWSRDYEMSTANLLTKIAEPGITGDACRSYIIDSYRHMAYEQADAYRELFLRIANGSLPLLFHCAAGKDRTGIGAALLLETLNVPRATVIEDYLLTELFLEQNVQSALSSLGLYVIRGMSRQVWEPLMRAEAIYLETMFEEVEARHGSVAGFLRDVLKLDDEIPRRIRERLLEPRLAA
jgi:protein-tyrosine phosphatase